MRARNHWTGLSAWLVLLVSATTSGCGSSDVIAGPQRLALPKLASPELAPRGTNSPQPVASYGKIRVLVRTVGSKIDRNGYMVQTDGYWDYTYPLTRMRANSSLMFEVDAGTHSLTLYDLAPNCTGNDLEYRGVQVAENKETVVVFIVTCK